MKSKNLVALSLLGVLSLGSVSAFAATSNDTTTAGKPVVAVSTQAIKDAKSKITEEKATEIIQQSLEKYFSTKIEGKNLKLDVRPSFDGAESKEVAEWIIYWRDQSLSSLWKQEDTSIIYGGIVDAKTGEVKYVSVKNGDANKAAQKMSVKEMKKLSIDFITKHNLVNSVDKLKLVGEYSLDSNDKQKQYVFSYGEKNTDVIYITVDLVNKNVSAFAGGTLDMENTKKITE